MYAEVSFTHFLTQQTHDSKCEFWILPLHECIPKLKIKGLRLINVNVEWHLKGLSDWFWINEGMCVCPLDPLIKHWFMLQTETCLVQLNAFQRLMAVTYKSSDALKTSVNV